MSVLKHVKISDNVWVWQCPICDKLLAPHAVKHPGLGQVMQSKGAASRHLMMHDYNLVQHGRDINKIHASNFYITESEYDELRKNGWIWITTPRENKYRNKRYGPWLYLPWHVMVKIGSDFVVGLGDLNMDIDKTMRDGRTTIGNEMYWYKLELEKAD
jgi:hypothetical protein